MPDDETDDDWSPVAPGDVVVVFACIHCDVSSIAAKPKLICCVSKMSDLD